jgi:ligand-binding sensor domain-containing protein
MKKTLLLALMALNTNTGFSQHLYSEKYEGCLFSSFCLDCGDTKASPPKTFVSEVVNKLDKATLSEIKGTIEVQILIDENGKPCLLSSTNQTNIPFEKIKLQNAINSTSYWQAAISENKKTSSSVSIIFEFDNGNVSAKRRVFDFLNQSNMKSEGTPNAIGTDKKDLSKSWSVFTRQNSELPWDMARAIAVDLNNNIWIGTDNGIVEIENNKWVHFDSKNTIISPTLYNKNETQSVRYLEVDKNNNKWFVIDWDVYCYDNRKWTKYDSLNSPINWARTIFVDQSNNVWFTSWDGVSKFDGKKWTVFNKRNSGLPTDTVLSAYVDKKNKLWIGTFEGNVIIENGITKLLNDRSSPLSESYISKMYEDKKGNFWFSLYNEKSDKAGMYVLDSLGKWSRINHPDPKMFVDNDINDFYLDEEKDLLWITLNGVGILNYDLKTKKWEVYTNKNSEVPSVYAEQIAKDKDGHIWIATYAGVIKLNK